MRLRAPARGRPIDGETPASGPTGLPVLTEMDIAFGWPFGVVPLPSPPEVVHADPVHALREALRPALLRPPCVVAFSGGRDSSLVLAHAADLAAREGLPAPVALTFRYPGDPAAEESSWQELVFGHLRGAGLDPEWVRRDVTDELDNIGALTAPVLRAHGGPTFPAGLGSAILQASYAAGGSLVTGNYGDEVVGDHRMGALRALPRRRGRGLTRAQWRLVAKSAMPARLRSWQSTRGDLGAPWLRPATLAALVREARLRPATPLRWDRGVWAIMGLRAASVNYQTRYRVLVERDCRLVEPLGSVGFVASYAGFGKRWGGLTRTDGVRLLSGDLLPDAVICRTQKAYFNGSRFGRVTREFARTWDGRGLNDDLVDAEQLREAWLSDLPPGCTGPLLQQAWLASSAGGP